MDIHTQLMSITLLVVALLRAVQIQSFATGRRRAGVGLANVGQQQLRVLHHGAVDEDPRDVVVLRRGGHALVLDEIGLAGCTGRHRLPGQPRLLHVVIETTWSCRRAAFVVFHTLNERPGLNGSGAGVDGSDVVVELVQRAQLKDVACALVCAVLAGEGSVLSLLGVSLYCAKIQITSTAPVN
jgi:hypothetical protein